MYVPSPGFAGGGSGWGLHAILASVHSGSDLPRFAA